MSKKIDALFDPNRYQEPLNIKGISRDVLATMLKKMILIRKAEEKISENVASKVVQCPCHLAIGQEATAVALALNSRKSDKVFGAHRSHAHYLALNEDTYSLFSEVLGKYDGCSKGMGGSMHIIDRNNGFLGSVPIVGATIPIATGAGLASKMDDKGDIAVSYFGDGACEEGVLHESLNLAAIMKLPVLYICENNLFSSHLNISQRQPLPYTSRFAKAHDVKSKIIDGNDVVKIYKILNEEIHKIRIKKKPFYLETITYRWKGHVGHREDEDVGVKRKKSLEKWKKRDPIKRLSSALLNADIITFGELKNLNEVVKNKIDKDWEHALKADNPPKEFLLKPVYDK